MKVHVYFNFPGNSEEAMMFYHSVLGGKLNEPTRYKDMSIPGVELSNEEKEKIMHMSLELSDDYTLMATDAIDSVGQEVKPGNNVIVSLHPTSMDEAEKVFAELSEGGKVGMKLEKQMWGDYYGDFVDKFGIHWMVNYHPEGE